MNKKINDEKLKEQTVEKNMLHKIRMVKMVGISIIVLIVLIQFLKLVWFDLTAISIVKF